MLMMKFIEWFMYVYKYLQPFVKQYVQMERRLNEPTISSSIDLKNQIYVWENSNSPHQLIKSRCHHPITVLYRVFFIEV